MSGRKITGLPLPETPQEAPPEIRALVDQIEANLTDSKTMEAAQTLGLTFDYLTKYFAAIAGGVANGLGLESDTSVSLDFTEASVQLKERLLTLGEKATDPASKLVRSVFFVGATRQTPTPRRHARLLNLGGIPIRGYLPLEEWVKLVPGEAELATDSKANRELLRYLPILKEWLTATANFFPDITLESPVWSGHSIKSFQLDAGGGPQTVGPIAFSEAIAKLVSGLAPRKAAAGPVETGAASVETPSAAPVAPAPVAPKVEPTVPADQVQATPPVVVEPATAVPVAETATAVPVAEPAAKAPVTEPAAKAPVTESAAKAPVTEPAPVVPTPVSPQPAAQAEPLQQQAPSPAQTESSVPAEAPRAPQPPKSTKPDDAGEDPGFPVVISTVPQVEAPRPSVEPSVEIEKTVGLNVPPPQIIELGSEEIIDDENFDFDADIASVKDILEPAPRTADDEIDGKSLVEIEFSDPTAPPKPEPVATTPEPVSEEPVSPVSATPEPAVSILAVEAAPAETPVKPARVKPVLPNVVKAAAKKAPSAPPPELVLYPMVEGPPPEFFDEVDVEVDYPEVLVMALNDLNGAIESNDDLLICGQMQRCFDLLIQFFAGVSGSVLQEIDPDQLFDFDVEDGRFDLELKLELLVSALSSLEVHWEGNDVATLIWSVFYDTLLPATDPNCAYLHTRLLGVEGLVQEPLQEFVDFCSVVPGQGSLAQRSACREAAHRYLPILSFWLENAMPLFLESEVDFVEEDAGEALSWAASIAGTMLDGTPSGLWLEIAESRWNLPRPGLAPVFVNGDAPEVLLPMVDELNDGLEARDFQKAGLYVRTSLDFLIQYFTGCAAALWREQGEMSDQARELYTMEASLVDKERLLMLTLGGISTASDVGTSLSKVFSQSSLQYRAIARRGQPANMEPIAQWSSKREPVSEDELLVYLPLLRSWLGASNPWFSAGEQLFEEPSDAGFLEGVVAYGDDFLEMVDPEFVIQLTPECLSLADPDAQPEAAAAVEAVEEKEFTGVLPELPIMFSGPPVLVNLVTRLLESSGDRRSSNAWLGSSIEYLIQYFAGLCTTVLGAEKAPLSREAMMGFSPTASLRERELLLVDCIRQLKEKASGEVQVALRDIFVRPDGQSKTHTKLLGAEGAGSFHADEMLLSYWCRLRHQSGSLTSEDYRFGVQVLTTWVESCQKFFDTCEHYAEDPGADGQEEMVIELAEDYLDMVLPGYAIQTPARGYYEVLYAEPDIECSEELEIFFPEDVRPNLLGPKVVELGGIAGDGGDELLGAATDSMELGGDDMFAGAAGGYQSDDLFAGSAAADSVDTDALFSGAATATSSFPADSKPKAKPAKASKDAAKAEKPTPVEQEPESKRRRKRKRSKKAELGSAVLELYKKERLEKARKRAEARARKADVEPSRMSHALDYKGLKNSKQLGGRVHFGVIELKNTGGGELKGTVEAAHPCVKVQPSRFEGNEVRVVYQVDPSDMPSTGRVGLSINTQDERIELRLDRLVPTSWWRELSVMEAIGMMSLPSVCYAMWIIVLTAFMGPGIIKALTTAVMSSQNGDVPWGLQAKLWVFAMFIILPGSSVVPGIVKHLYSKLDITVQGESRWWLAPSMLLPSGLFALLMFVTGLWTVKIPVESMPPLASRTILTLLTLGLNLIATVLFSLQTTTWWEERSDTAMAKNSLYIFSAITVVLALVTLFLP